MLNCRYNRLMFAPETGADGGASTNSADNGVENGGQERDYAAEFLALEAKYKSLKESFDKKASQLSAKEKAEREKMSEAEKLQAEREEEKQRYLEMQNRVYEMETTTLFAEQGFDKKDYGELVKQVVAVGGDKSSELAETFLAFVKKSSAAAVASAKNGAIRDGAVTPNASSTQGGQSGKSDYQLYQEGKTKTNNIVEL